MGMSNLEERAQSENDTCKAMTAPIVAILIMQGNDLPNHDECSKMCLEIKAELDRKSAIIERKLPELTLRSVNEQKKREPLAG